MGWRVESEAEQGRYAAWGDGGLEVDDRTRQLLEGYVGELLPLTVTGPYHALGGLDDELGVFLAALNTDAVPPPRRVTGTPPPAPVAAVPDGATP